MNLSQLERILLVAQTKNITAAAQKLFISQPALTQMISTIEQEIGARIFIRNVTPLKLTYEGECFIRTAQQILSANRIMLDQIRNSKSGLVGKITIGVSIPRCRYIMLDVIPRMLSDCPNVTLNFVDGKSADFERDILLGNVDLALSNIPPSSEQVGCYVLNRESYYLVANRNSAIAQRLDALRFACNTPEMPFSLKEASEENFILLHSTRNSRIAFNQMARELSISPHISIEAYNSDIALECVEIGAGVALLASVESNIRPFCYQTDKLSFFVLDSKYAFHDLYLFYNAVCERNPAMQRMIDLLLESFGRKKVEKQEDKTKTAY